MLDYKLIEALAMVVEEGGFEKAARRLHLTQSAVSQRVRQLEDQAGGILLVRSNPPAPTPAGLRMIKHFLKVKALEDDLSDLYDAQVGEVYSTLAIGLNGDSLATWFMDSVREFLDSEQVLLDLRADDQDQTHRMLRDGEVTGCISTKSRPMQGCRLDYLGAMDYRMLAAPGFMAKWFSGGLTVESARRAPIVIFNRRDNLHSGFFRKALGAEVEQLSMHYLPSAERFVDFIARGHAYGMLPDHQSRGLVESGRLKEVAPGCAVPVHLYWHCWNVRSRLLESFSRHLVQNAGRMLKRSGSNFGMETAF